MLKIYIVIAMIGLTSVVKGTSSLPNGTKFIQASRSLPLTAKKYTSIIFDLSGVLINEKQIRIVSEMLFPGSAAADIMSTIYRGTIWPEFSRGSASFKSLTKRVELEHGFNAELTAAILTQIVAALPLLPKGVEMLKLAKSQGYKVYAFSNAYEGVYASLCKAHPTIFSLFDGAIMSCDIHAIKPEPKMYQILLDRYQINPSEALFIDDQEINVLGGTSLGIDGIVCRDTNEALQLLQQNNILSSSRSQP
jgi:HAD superfamily hydrolase (TIGR01509 family)